MFKEILSGHRVGDLFGAGQEIGAGTGQQQRGAWVGVGAQSLVTG